MRHLKFLTVFLAVLILAPGAALAAEMAITVGGSGMTAPDLSASVFHVDFERSLSDNMSFYVRGGALKYEYDDGDYWEDGEGPGVEGGVRFYPGGDALSGFFLGGGIGMWQTEWDWVDRNAFLYYYNPYYYSGSGDSLSTEIHFVVGARIGDKVQFVPTFQLGHWISTDAELGLYGVFGAAVSFRL